MDLIGNNCGWLTVYFDKVSLITSKIMQRKRDKVRKQMKRSKRTKTVKRLKHLIHTFQTHEVNDT